MRAYPALMSVIVLLFSSSLLATQEPDVKFVVKYDGGTLALAHQTIDFHVVNDDVVLIQDGDTVPRFWVFPAGRDWRLAEPKGRLSEKKYQRRREKVPKTSPLEDQKLMAVIH